MGLPIELLSIFLFIWHDNFIDKSIGDYILEKMTIKIKITNDIFSNNIFFIRYSINNCNSDKIKL
jgi:hypothetical protein